MKKKGLIISTIVMVVVLIASLTTATYAWFNSTAEARVENISILTVNATGLQVAVDKGSDTYVSGAITYANNAFDGDVPDWGELVDFSEISSTLGNISKAVTRVGSTAEYTNKVFKTPTAAPTSETYTSYYFAKTTNGTTAMTLATDETWGEAEGNVNATNTDWYEQDTSFVVGDYLSPIGYNLNAQKALTPYGYTKAAANTANGYLDLPIAVRATEAMKAVLCTMTITPLQGTAAAKWNNYKPGMAAALRIRISDGTNVLEVEPYHDVARANSGFTNARDEAFELNFVVAYSAGLSGAYVQALDPLSHTYTVWIEGEDGECIDIVTGTGAQVDLAYNYIEANNTAATITTESSEVTTKLASLNMATSGNVQNIVSSAPTGYITLSNKDYLIFAISSSKSAPVTP